MTGVLQYPSGADVTSRTQDECRKNGGCDMAGAGPDKHEDGGRCRSCPYKFVCPHCAAPVGGRCSRPSGHKGNFIGPRGMHEARLRLADLDAFERVPRAELQEYLGDELVAWERKLGLAKPAARPTGEITLFE